MYYDRYVRSVSGIGVPKGLGDLISGKPFPEIIAWILTDPIGASQGLNLVCYQLIVELAQWRRAEVTDDEGTLSYYKILCHPAITKFTGMFDTAIGTVLGAHDHVMRSLGHAIRYAFHMVSFKEQGCRRYQVSEGLAAELANTAFSELRCQDVRLPFPSIYLDVPKSLGLEVHNQMTGLHPLEGVFLSEDRVILRQTEGEKLRSGRTKLEDIELGVGRALHSMMIGTSKNPEDPMDDATCVTSMDMVAERPLEQEVAATARAADLSENFRRFPIIMAWVTNVLLYATWPDALLEQAWADPKAERLWKASETAVSKGQARKLRQKLQQHHATDRVTVMGRNILVDRTAPSYREDSGGEGRTLEVRIKVTGHMKRQACGPGWSEHKIIWVRPYWKGPEDGPVKFSSHELVAKYSEPEESHDVGRTEEVV